MVSCEKKKRKKEICCSCVLILYSVTGCMPVIMNNTLLLSFVSVPKVKPILSMCFHCAKG